MSTVILIVNLVIMVLSALALGFMGGKVYCGWKRRPGTSDKLTDEQNARLTEWFEGKDTSGYTMSSSKGGPYGS